MGIMGNNEGIGMSIVTVNKEQLLEILRKNRDAHTQEYSEIRKAFEEAFVKAAAKLLKSAKAGDYTKSSISLSCPNSHEKDYSRIIRMLEMSVATEVQVSEDQFQQYVEDDWDWKHSFELSKSTYLGR
jgi:hypothetical protein